MKQLLRTTDPMKIIYAKALLAGDDINCFEMDVHMSVLEGSVGILPRRLMVLDDDLAEARQILIDNEFELEPE
ncbi:MULTISPECIES: putative signal transducing protein [Pacificibacter]|uniref:putative signal transducing protein n=1 Tax=Pacificibacter TaxID=1042323 RepID=UPI001C098E5A|nr:MULTISPECIES: DUF2007 domain-containing protein [Pacificibacter]MBU2934681.1 DUF2007 domain-containing protein [Pacificibacter marinus]MDO6616877.1 DUF2007 domain-containing protein [Pacificibacter sp. 1_MG-2023]